MTSPRYASAWGEAEEAPRPVPHSDTDAVTPREHLGDFTPNAPSASHAPAPKPGSDSPFCDALNDALERSRHAHPQAKFRGWPWFANKVLNAHPSAITRMRGGHATLASMDLIARKLKWRVTIHIEGE